MVAGLGVIRELLRHTALYPNTINLKLFIMKGKIMITRAGISMMIPAFMILFAYGQSESKNNVHHRDPGLVREDSIPLFNGKDLENWDFVTSDSLFTGNAGDIFTVEDGLIHVYAHQQPFTEQTFAGLYTRKSYSDYRLMLEYKWGEKKFEPRHESVRDAGVLFHVIRKDVFWPYGVELQIQEGDTGDIWVIGTQASARVHRINGNYDAKGTLMTKGTTEEIYNRFPRSYSWEVPGWNKIEIEVVGDHARYWVNGHLVNEAMAMKYWSDEKGTWEPLLSGSILLQAEGSEIFYRNIYLKPL